MSFDGKKYNSARYTLPTYYHPHAAFQSQAVANCLQNAYFAAQQNSRLVLQAVFPATIALNYVTQEEFSVSSTALVQIAKGYAFIPDKVTHVTASINYAALSVEGGKVDHKLTVTNSVTPTPGAVTQTKSDPIPPGIPGRSASPSNNVLGYPPGLANQNLSDFQPVSTSTVSVRIEKADGGVNLPVNQLCTIEVFGHAYFFREYLGTNTAQWYRPHFVSVYLETRAQE